MTYLQPTWDFQEDLKTVLEQSSEIWPELIGARIFITGGTGFIGCCVLEALCYADKKLNLGLQVVILSRNPEKFKEQLPHLANYPSVSLITGDVAQFPFPDTHFSHIIHAATDASANLNENDPLRMFDTILQGTRHTLDFAEKIKTARVLFLSSGAVYGQQPWEMERVSEKVPLGPMTDDSRNTYAEAKRAAEMLCAIYDKQFGLSITVARIFSLIGPYLKLGIHFAAGNFIRNAMNGAPVIVNGNGLPCRSYLYTSDLVVWLLHLLVLGKKGQVYNVGSEKSVSIKQLAEQVANVIGNGKFQVLGKVDNGWNPGRYVPDASKIKNEFNLKETVSLEQAIMRTACWNGWKGKI